MSVAKIAVNTPAVDISSVDIGIAENSTYNDIPMQNKGGISSTVILTIVIIVCVILGIGLGILSGKRSANK